MGGCGRQKHRKIQAVYPLGCGEGSGIPCLLTLKRGKKSPHFSFSPVKWRLRKMHCLLCSAPPHCICLGNLSFWEEPLGWFSF